MFKSKQESKIEIWGIKYINGIRNAEDKNKKIIQIEPVGNNNYMVEIVEEGTTDNAVEILMLQQTIESLEKRLKHLLSSDVIRRYDEIDRRTGKYVHDVSAFDYEYRKYKAGYEVLLKCSSCNTCAEKINCKYKSWGDNVAYNCPHFKPHSTEEG